MSKDYEKLYKQLLGTLKDCISDYETRDDHTGRVLSIDERNAAIDALDIALFVGEMMELEMLGMFDEVVQ